MAEQDGSVPRPDLIARIVDSGAMGATCLLGWCWIRGTHECRYRPAYAFQRLAPISYLELQVGPFLEGIGLLQRAGPAIGIRRLTGAALTEWGLSDSIGSMAEVEDAAYRSALVLARDSSCHGQIASVWRELATAEVLGFLEAELEEHRFTADWALVVTDLVDRALTDLSIAECFYFCWLTVRDLASAYLKRPDERERLMEILRTSLGSKLMRAHHERWQIRPFSRHTARPASAMAHVLASVLTNLESGYLSRPPNELSLRL